MRKRYRQGMLLSLTSLVLTGCINHLDTEEVEPKANEVAVQTTKNRTGVSEYKAVITEGRYQLGAAGSVYSNLSSVGNYEAFEEGLIRISQSIFPTDQYLLQEGQLIDSETLASWAGRESDTNPDGLNPARVSAETPVVESTESAENAESTQESTAQVINEATAAPIYLTQIMEKDIMIETDQGYSLGGIVIGLAMNSEYEYTDTNGVVHRQEISVGEVRERGKAYANKIVGRLRATEALRSVPVVVAIYNQAPSDDVVGGTYLLDGVSREGNSVADWTEHNESRVLLPETSGNGSNDQYQYFTDFKQKIDNFFPNLNGITAEALMVEGQLHSLNVEITTQFYGLTQITALTQHVMDMAQAHLPKGVALQIVINSIRGTEAFIARPADSETFESHVFK